MCGENGAGKSTLVKILAGVYPNHTYEGKIYFNDEEIKFTHFSVKQAIKKGIAIVYQELALVPPSVNLLHCHLENQRLRCRRELVLENNRLSAKPPG